MLASVFLTKGVDIYRRKLFWQQTRQAKQSKQRLGERISAFPNRIAYRT